MIMRSPVQSSNVISVGYDESSQTLEIEYNDGAVYQYYNVPATVHAGLMNAASVGKFIHQNIKNAYPFARI